ncbi:MBL fold metallo-hydrolase [Aureimonas ureilytica]|uniref:MBL fold metallo-hydrolase n=1 Tax=Aureimonas ureilytica TaxID=401562 RepID=UPI00036A39B6|nr:MBL fold metallo-hydrolase [Aureimonas ureilytica]
MAGNPYYSGPVSDHFDGTRFFNPEGMEPRPFLDVLRWQFGGGRVAWPASAPSPFPSAVPDARVADLRVTMVGHATLLVQIAGLNILTDPVWSERVSPFSFIGPKRVVAPGIAFDALPPIDLVLLSHNHYDHLDVETLARLQAAHDPLIVTPLGNDRIVRDAVPKARLSVGDWGDRIDAPGATIHVEPAHHWSARGTRDRRMALWASFAVETSAGRIYHVGDTGFHRGVNYRAASAKHGGFRLAILPIGAYAPRWFMEAQHQNPDEAVEGMVLAKADFAVGHHWATFQLTDEALGEPAEALRTAMAARGLPAERFRAMRAGESWDVPALPAL